MLDLKDSVNKVIKDIQIGDSSFVITFEDDTNIEFFDDNQSCCEKRYMNTDDTLIDMVGGKLIAAAVVSGGEFDKDGDTQECAFLIITTTKGMFTIANYNEHNGYYGGINIIIKYN
jgi:hypothetical protein